MDVILHLGAHRTASTSFQRVLAASAAPLAQQGVGVWGPKVTRTGLLHNLASPGARPRDAGRLRLALAAEAARGTDTLIVSDENMIGTPRACLRHASLYPAVGERTARLGRAFAPTRALLQVRALDTWWSSLLAYLVQRGAPVPSGADLASLLASSRDWRDVIVDVSCALPPGTDLVVTSFERFAGAPGRLLACATDRDNLAPLRDASTWANRAPTLCALRRCLAERGASPGLLPEGEGRWQPFPQDAAAMLRARYQDDLYWLRAGADGLARYLEDPVSEKAGPIRPPHDLRRGQDNECDQGRLEGAG